MDSWKLITGVILFFFLDVMVIISLYLAWIKKKTSNKVVPNSFPYVATKKQSTIWFIAWSLVVFFDIGVYTLIAWLFAIKFDPNDGMLYASAFFITAVGYTLVMLIIYSAVKSIVTEKLGHKTYGKTK